MDRQSVCVTCSGEHEPHLKGQQMKTPTRQKPIMLDFAEAAGRQIMVTPEDQDRFFITVEQAIEACVASKAQKPNIIMRFEKQYNALLNRLANWAEDHRSKITNAYLTVRDSDVLFVVVQREPVYDRALEDDLTALDMEVARDEAFGLIRMNVLGLPFVADDGDTAFLVPDRVLEYRLSAE